MQQRRLRLGDILDDYCPRERRITNHAVVAMIDDEVKQTRCTTCDADHEYRQAKVPPPRRKKTDALVDSPEGTLRARPASETPISSDDTPSPDHTPGVGAVAAEPSEELFPAEPTAPEPEPVTAGAEDEGPVHRRLIRATLPRPEGQAPERKMPDFTIRQPGGHGGRPFDGNKNGHRHGRRPARAPGGAIGQKPRFGGSRHGSGQGTRHGTAQSPRHGSGSGHLPSGPRSGQAGGGQRGGRPGQGHGRGGGRRRGR